MKKKIVFFLLNLFLKPTFFLLSYTHIRIGLIDARIGNSSIYLDYFLRKKQKGEIDPKLKYIFFVGNYCNSFLLELFSQHMTIVRSRGIYFLLSRSVSLLEKYGVLHSGVQDENKFSIYSETRATLVLKDNDSMKAGELLKSLGLDIKKDKYVCMFSRDSAFLNHVFPGRDWSYHDYRNIDIDKFIDAVKYVISEGYYVVRIGNIVEKPLSFRHEKLIDYPFSGVVSDNMDVFLAYNSQGVIGTESGATDLFKIFDKPLLIVNYSVVGKWPWGHNALYNPVSYECLNTGKLISYYKALELGLNTCYKVKDIQGKGVRLIQNTSEDILLATKEFISRLKGEFFYTHSQERLMKLYFDGFVPKTNYSSIKTPIAISFLEGKKELFLESVEGNQLENQSNSVIYESE